MTVRDFSKQIGELSDDILSRASDYFRKRVDHGDDVEQAERYAVARACHARFHGVRPGRLEEFVSDDEMTPALVHTVYERLLGYRLRGTGSDAQVSRDNGRRKSSGSYFTPRQLVTPLLEATVSAVLNQRVAQRVFQESDVTGLPPLERWSPRELELAAATLLEMRVCDPSCGPGVFLDAVVEKLAEYLSRFQLGCSIKDCASQIARQCVYGVDTDPMAVVLSRFSLWLLAGKPRGRLSEVAPHVCCRDSLSVEENRPFDPNQVRPINWQDEFPQVFAAGGFDVVLGNPPFANAIEGGIDTRTKEHLSQKFPELVGTSDLAYYFLALGDRLAKSDGAVGFILPRGVLTSRATIKLRERLLETRPPKLINAPQNQYLFPGANVFVVALALRLGGTCLGGRDPQATNLVPIEVRDTNWWAPLMEDSLLQTRGTHQIGQRFEVFASMTTGMAYDLREFVTDEPLKDALRLVTTGLIDPGECLWGQQTCRYLKSRFERPVVDESPELPAYVASRLKKVRRPKILVAGLSTRIEAFLDAEGICCGAVSTYTIVHPRDDVLELRGLCHYLNGDEPTRQLNIQLGAHAMGGGRITVSKSFLQQLPLP